MYIHKVLYYISISITNYSIFVGQARFLVIDLCRYIANGCLRTQPNMRLASPNALSSASRNNKIDYNFFCIFYVYYLRLVKYHFRWLVLIKCLRQHTIYIVH